MTSTYDTCKPRGRKYTENGCDTGRGYHSFTKTKTRGTSHITEAVTEISRQCLLQVTYLLTYIYLDQMSRFLCRETEFIMHVLEMKSYSEAVFILWTMFIKLKFVERKTVTIKFKICLRIY